ncbi:MAG: NAD(P)/FAD-dependent oxidoreductase [Bacteroidales bacterium]|jgi:phytoene dehydrogenase-like protein|nr:NAD(P)/FAD-dependent oxidoreductase [Bacteroidales bacterium]
MNKHVIIIGSGLGGLSCGYVLSKNGYRVTVLEKNAQSGGCLQTFVRNGVKFETGMHYIGSIEEGQTLYQLFKYLDLFKDVKLRPLDKMAYETIVINDKQYPCAIGNENFVEQLTRYFPKERKNLQQYYKVITKTVENFPLQSLRPPESFTQYDYSCLQTSASEFIEGITSNQMLQQVLAGNLPLYGGVYGKTSLFVHALIRDFFNKSACRIVGGSDAIALSLVKSIRQMGGEVYTNAQVNAINCNDTKAVSVTLQNGEKIAGDYFISNAHPARLMEMVGNTSLLRKIYRQRIMESKNTISNFTVYIKFKKDTIPYLNSNMFYHNYGSVWDYENYTQKTWSKGFLYMHGCSSIDGQYADTAVLIAGMHFDEVERWKGTKQGQRGNDYEDFKQRKAEKLLNELEKQNPGILKNIETFYTSSPLTYFDYTGTERGSMYGILRDCTQAVQFRISQRTKIPNLYQTGQNINKHGILGVLIGSLITASEFLGMEKILEDIRQGS